MQNYLINQQKNAAIRGVFYFFVFSPACYLACGICFELLTAVGRRGIIELPIGSGKRMPAAAIESGKGAFYGV